MQSDKTLLLEVDSPDYPDARAFLSHFAELEKSPEHIHTYRITPLSLWNAAAAGFGHEAISSGLQRFSRYPIPEGLLEELFELLGRFGKIKLLPAEGKIALHVIDEDLKQEILAIRECAELIEDGPGGLLIAPIHRGELKQRLMRLGLPVDDRVGFGDAAPCPINLKSHDSKGQSCELRDYQHQAIDGFLQQGIGHGVVVLPCGAGKTLVGMGVMAELGFETLILCASTSAANQWRDELLDKTDIAADKIGLFCGKSQQIRSITITTYQKVAARRRSGNTGRGEFANFDKLTQRLWGLLIFDEVHLLPAPVFRLTAALQSRRRLGLTATLIREDGLETDVFSLVGPKRFDMPWKEMENLGHIATARCVEIRVALSDEDKLSYRASSDNRHKCFALAAKNPAKIPVLVSLLEQHHGEQVLVIGHFVAQLEEIGRAIGAPVITGKVDQARRDKLYDEFRAGKISVLVVSRVANFSIDLPSASVCIQVSGTFGSRQEEAQRLGRILRPQDTPVHFYTLVSKKTVETRYAMNRQLFLTEQGYGYRIREFSGEAKPAYPSNVIPFRKRAT